MQLSACLALAMSPDDVEGGAQASLIFKSTVKIEQDRHKKPKAGQTKPHIAGEIENTYVLPNIWGLLTQPHADPVKFAQLMQHPR